MSDGMDAAQRERRGNFFKKPEAPFHGGEMATA
jgi:hypothetical protein